MEEATHERACQGANMIHRKESSTTALVEKQQPTDIALGNDQTEYTDQRTTHEIKDTAVPVAGTTDKASNIDSEERKKHERRRRRCPVVKIEKYLNNNEHGEGEKKEDGAAGSNRSLARTIMQEDVAGFLRLVQEEGACVRDTDCHGWSPLHWACSRGSTVMTYAILKEMRSSQEAGATDDAISNYLNATEELSGWTALHLATIAGKLDVVYLLLEAGCDSQVKDKVGDRPANCIRRTKNPDGVAERLRNALLDLSDSEDT